MRTYIRIVAVLGVLFSRVASADLNTGLLLRLPFEGNVQDQSGNGNNGTVQGGVSFGPDRFGAPTSACHFDGITGRVNLPSTLKPPFPLTVAFWVRVAGMNSRGVASVFRNDQVDDGGFRYGADVVVTDAGAVNAYYFEGFSAPANRVGYLSNGSLFQLGEWHHCAVVYQAHRNVTIYWDCSPVPGTYDNGTGGGMSYSSSAGAIGHRITNNPTQQLYFNGDLDDLRFYNRALSESEIHQLCGALPETDPTPESGACPGAGSVVGTVRKLSELTTPSLQLVNGSSFGEEVEDIGDLNGDGSNELAVGSIFETHAGKKSGVVRILFMNPSGIVDSIVKIAEAAGGFADTLQANCRFGDGIAGIGDLDRDGIPDIAIGASHFAPEAGVLWICFMRANGTLRESRRVTQGTPGFTGQLEELDNFGTSLEGMGRCCGDSLTLLAVGAHGDDDGVGGLPGDSQPGAIYLLRLRDNGSVAWTQKISQSEGGLGHVLGNNELFGESLADIGDLDGDGTKDLAVGALEFDPPHYGAGAVWILFLNTNGLVKRAHPIRAGDGRFRAHIQSVDYFGSALSSLGDLGHDGTVELAAGAPNDDDGGANRGAVWILSLTPDGTVDCWSKLSQTVGGFAAPLKDFDGFGLGLAAPHDPSGDPGMRLAIGAFGDDDGGAAKGAVWLADLALQSTTGVSSGVPNVGEVGLGVSSNPVLRTLRIQYTLESQTPTRLSLFDASGRLVRDFARELVAGRAGDFVWDGTGARGTRVPAGIYYLRLVSGRSVISKKIAVLR